MDAPDILIRTLSTPVPIGPSKALWQYHSRSDRHSKVACWGILFDLLQTSSLLRAHVADGKVFFGVNHTMRDFVHNKEKKLDLVLCRPEPSGAATRSGPPVTLQLLADRWQIKLTPLQQATLDALPAITQAPVGAVLTALEAKATMTEHKKAGPRLYDELNSSHQIVHASSNRALSIGFFMVKRSGTSGDGYDGLAIVVIDMPNDGTTAVRLIIVHQRHHAATFSTTRPCSRESPTSTTRRSHESEAHAFESA